MIKISASKKGLKVESAHQYNTERIYNSYLSNDTIFLKSKSMQGYTLWDNLDKIYNYKVKTPKSEDIMMLPDGSIIPKKYEPFKEHLLKIESTIVNPFLDSKGQLWVYLRGVHSGIYILKNSIWEKIELGINDGNYCDFFEDNLGDMWVGTYGEDLIHLYDKSLHILGVNTGLSSNNIWSVQQKSNGSILFSEGCSGITEISDSDKKVIYKGCYGTVYHDSHGRTWASTLGLELYENGKKTYFSKSKGLFSRTILSIFEDSNRDMWFGTRRVLHKYVDGRLKQYLIEDTDTYGRIYNIIELKNKSLLLAVDNGFFLHFQR